MEVDIVPELDGEENANQQQEQQTGTTNTRTLPKSQKWWKKPLNMRPLSNSTKGKPRSSWERKMRDKSMRDQTRTMQEEIRQRMAEERAEAAKARKEREERRKQNELKAQVVQVVRNTAKLKRMNRKQLKLIQKRDTLAESEGKKPEKSKAPVANKKG